jgi:hypothetical protein
MEYCLKSKGIIFFFLSCGKKNEKWGYIYNIQLNNNAKCRLRVNVNG